MEKQSSGCVFGAICFIAGAVVSGIAFFVIGAIFGNLQIYGNVRRLETDAAEKVLASSPDFAGLEFHAASTGDVDFYGEVPTDESLAEFKQAITREFWDKQLRHKTVYVKVAKP